MSKAKLIDFGIAKFPQPPGAPPFTQHSVLSGTVAYASPEQCQSRAVDHRSDIYSLGVMLYELLTGERPFKGRTPTEIAIHQLQTEPQPPRQLNPEIPLNLEKVVLRALAKSPADRQQSVQELADQLQANARQVIIPLLPEASADASLPEEIEEADAATIDRLIVVRRRRRRVAVAAVAMVLMVLAGAMFGRNWLASRALPLLTSALPGASPTPEEVIASDADSLELAAQLSGDALAGGAAARNVPASTGSSPAQPSGASSSTSIGASGKTNSTDGVKPSGAVTPAPTPLTAKSSSPVEQPKTPSVVVAKSPSPPNPPVKQPESASTRQKTDDRKIRQREQDTSPSTPNGTVAREEASAAKRDRIATNRNRNEEPQRRQPEARTESHETVSDSDEPDDTNHDSQQIGPKLIQWSGKVRGEREITIDLPGTPGTLEIPRVYRQRVGVVEPPSASNRWRFARLRVFGDGGVSFVVRWWPNSSPMSRIAGR